MVNHQVNQGSFINTALTYMVWYLLLILSIYVDTRIDRIHCIPKSLLAENKLPLPMIAPAGPHQN